MLTSSRNDALRQWSHHVLGTAGCTGKSALGIAARMVDELPLSQVLPHFDVYYSYLKQKVKSSSMAASSAHCRTSELLRMLNNHQTLLQSAAGINHQQLVQQVTAAHAEFKLAASMAQQLQDSDMQE